MKKNQDFTPVRLSHLLGFSSVGAVVRGPHYLMAVKDTSYWISKDGTPGGQLIYYVEQVKSALGIDKALRSPPIAKEQDGWVDGVYIPAQIFPSWMKCTRCHFISCKPWRSTGERFPFKCARAGCHGKLEQMPWVLVHAKGFLSDVPYHSLTHKDSSINCKPDWTNVYLQAKPDGKKYQLYCEHCGATNKLSLNGHEVFWKGRQQPWRQEQPCAEVLNESPMWTILAVSDPRVHFTERKNALVIPPESRIQRGSVVDRLYSSADKRAALTRSKSLLAQKSAIKTVAADMGCSIESVVEALAAINNGYPLYGQNISKGHLLKSEYQALLELIPDLSEDEDFVTRQYGSAWTALSQQLATNSFTSQVVALVDAVIGVERLKEIMVMTGFGRLEMDAEKQTILPPDLVGESSWLPALELYGEGIFITLDQAILAQWEAQPELIRRVQQLEGRLTKAPVNFEAEVNLSPRFMLLHALSHGLIRQFESYAGYPAASLKERIYCSHYDAMAGILIYVAVPDVVGSLGGLAELAEPKRLLPIMLTALEQAQWCSLDPVCSEHDGQGPGLLNKAACHGCLLIPETSCSFGNLLLDRVFIKGSVEDGIFPITSFTRSSA
ncbi:MAG TPA: DUF1998 domain-containing protein [Marinospirillum sp.]|uniref:DUF1998 domain-containing protein n=1 Tax=Marinospirillum sp. TaxID=2183934 RepID=UPI002B45C6E1|nr:DUF1998 domain-containing protein [Marinospirillum sp.]HKM15562.1 DUF1998 domain-containing protein [Marinospirillum sp.]